MKYQLIKELSLMSILVEAEDGRQLVFDRVDFPVVPRDSFRLDLQKEVETIQAETIEVPPEFKENLAQVNFINYQSLEKYDNQMYLVREDQYPLGLKEFKSNDPERLCRVLLGLLHYIRLYHQNQQSVGGVSRGLLKEDSQGRLYIQNPKVIRPLSKYLNEEYRIVSPPEVIQGKPWGFKADIFSWAILAYSLLTGEEPFAADTPEEKIEKILKIGAVNLKDLRPEYSEVLSQLIMDCLSNNVNKRPSIDALVTSFTKIIETGAITVDENEIKAYQEKAALNRQRFERKERVMLWFRKYGVVSGGILAVLITGYIMIFAFRGEPTITESTKPIEVVNYYYQGIQKIDPVLVSEAVHKAKNSYEDVIANFHVINATRQGTTYSTKDNAQIQIEGLRVEKLNQSEKKVQFKVSYTLKFLMKPDSIEFLQRTEVLTLTPVKKVWRITQIDVLNKKEWTEPRTENDNP